MRAVIAAPIDAVRRCRRAVRTAIPPGSRRSVGVRVVAALAAGAVAGVLALSSTSATTGRVGPGTVELEAGLGGGDGGRTVLEVPPFGDVSARTHAGPVGMALRVEEVDLDQVQTLLAEGEPGEQLRGDVEADLRPLTGRLIRRALLLSAVVGAVAAAALPRRRWYSPVVGALGGSVAIAALMGATWRSFDAAAFEAAPVFEGPIEEAPRIVDTVMGHVADFEEVQDRYAILSNQIAELYSANIAADTGPKTLETVILHVTDLHLNPVGIDLVRQLAREFDVDAVLDTGDLTSFGQPFEAAVAPLLEQVGVPYLFVPGNHDSPDNVAAIAGAANVTVLDRTVAEVGDVTILGVGDPSFSAKNEITSEDIKRLQAEEAPRLRPLLLRHRPDLLAVHNPRLAWESGGLVDVAVAGHFHSTSVSTVNGLQIFVLGSTGGEGLGEFTEEGEPRYEAQLLRFSGDRLVAVDHLALEGRDGGFQIAREVVDGGRRRSVAAPR